MQVFLLALEKKQEPMVKIIGAYLEFINLKKLNNSSLQHLKKAGKHKRK